ncbi:MAG: hypothetical protein ACI4C3_05985 [Bacteroides sp.]
MQRNSFLIPKLHRERNLYGSDFEVKLRNKLEQKAIAKEWKAGERASFQIVKSFTTEWLPSEQLQKRIRAEKQFARQVEMNSEARALKRDIARLKAELNQ